MRRASARRRLAFPAYALVLALAALAGGCVPATPDVDTYDDKARLTLGSAVSDVRTAETLLRTLDRDAMLRQTAIVELRYSQKSLGTAITAFTELNPPPQRDRFTTRMTTVLGDADDLLDVVRTAVERSERSAYPGLADDLERTARELERLEERVS